MKLSVIIPVYNESDTVLEVVDHVMACGVPDLEILVVNDCSTDGTAKVLEQLGSNEQVQVFHHEINQGKGAAIRTAQAHVTGDAVVIQDADMEYNPAELPRLLRPIEADVADVVYGSRYSGNEILIDTFWHYLGNKLLTTVSNVFSNLHLTDMETCYKMMRADIFTSMTLTANRFGIEPEFTAKLAKQNCRIYEIPISYRARRYEEGKKIGWKDGIAALWYIVKFNLFH